MLLVGLWLWYPRENQGWTGSKAGNIGLIVGYTALEAGIYAWNVG